MFCRIATINGQQVLIKKVFGEEDGNEEAPWGVEIEFEMYEGQMRSTTTLRFGSEEDQVKAFDGLSDSDISEVIRHQRQVWEDMTGDDDDYDEDDELWENLHDHMS
jgi:hypothetical protein